jgi:hypothetical protein
MFWISYFYAKSVLFLIIFSPLAADVTTTTAESPYSMRFPGGNWHFLCTFSLSSWGIFRDIIQCEFLGRGGRAWQSIHTGDHANAVGRAAF